MTCFEDIDDLRWSLALLRTLGVGPRTFKSLLDRCGSSREVMNASRASLSAIGLNSNTIDRLKEPAWGMVDDDLRWLDLEHHHCMGYWHDAYPAMLKEIADPPPLLFVEGDIRALSLRQLAIVGSRNPSPSGEKLAHDFAGALVETGFAVTSGLALGIDASAHRGALDGEGITLAVAGTGPDQIYPNRHKGLAEAIVSRGGALVSEFPTNTSPQAANFPRRNRIISGLSLGVIVVEAALRSGSLITARMALEQGREVFALPGSINNPLARGCNALIKQGAKLVETVDDILDEFAVARLPIKAPVHERQSEETLDSEHSLLLKYIAYAPTSVDTLVAATGKTPEAIAATLLLLELQGLIAAADGGYSRVR